MGTPGFTAEMSLESLKRQYRTSEAMNGVGAIHPAALNYVGSVSRASCMRFCRQQGGEAWECNWICNRPIYGGQTTQYI
jgi:hypothetical protein